jgi:hypothetical protein
VRVFVCLCLLIVRLFARLCVRVCVIVLSRAFCLGLSLSAQGCPTRVWLTHGDRWASVCERIGIFYFLFNLKKILKAQK